MNKTSILLVALLSIIYGFALGKYQIFPYQHLASIKKQIIGPQKPASGFVRTAHFDDRVSYFETNHLPNYDWVFVGDSITARAYWHELFPDVSVANRSIGGDITIGVLNRMESITNTHAKLALLMIGVNDIGRGFESKDIVKGQQQIIELLQKAKMKVVVQSVILSDGKVLDNQRILDLNTKLKAYCEAKGVLYFDLNAFLAPNGYLLDEYSADGLHLSGPAYRVWQQRLSEFIAANKGALSL